MPFRCENCIGMMEYGCYCDAHGASQFGVGYAHAMPCPVCDGAGEWDEGPLPASSGAIEPDYRQVFCGECEGAGFALVECEPRTLEDIEQEAADETEATP